VSLRGSPGGLAGLWKEVVVVTDVVYLGGGLLFFWVCGLLCRYFERI
jgi:hypothetical protein